MKTASRGFLVKILLDCMKFLQPVLKRVALHREEARKSSKELPTTYFGAVLKSAEAKKTTGSFIPEILLETNNWTFYVQFSYVQNLHIFCLRWETARAGHIKTPYPLSTPQCKPSGHHAKRSRIFLSAFLFYPSKAMEGTAGAPGELAGWPSRFQQERMVLLRTGEVWNIMVLIRNSEKIQIIKMITYTPK